MKKKNLKDLHVGKIIKEIAFKRGISSKSIACAINRSQQNADKIFWMDDMDIEDIIRISYLLEHNILFFIVNDFLSHCSYIDAHIETETCLLKVDMKNRCVVVNESTSNCNFLKDIHIGKHILKVANKNNWSGKDVAKLLHCTPSMVSYLFRCKSLKIKKLIQISEALHYDFISNEYLSKITIANSLNFLEDCMIIVNRNKIQIINSIDNSCMLFFRRNVVKN